MPSQTVYPIFLTHLAGAPVVVIGGGVVAARKVLGLLAVGAATTVIAPALGETLAALHQAGSFVWQKRAYQTGDVQGARLVFAATNDRAVNAQVAADAARHQILCNVADDPQAGDFHVPALLRPDGADAGMVIAVGSGGQSPRRTTALRNRIATWLAGNAA
jgi:cobalt-precorrin 5A hydrolase/precorrin-3B C17-methyltransferase